MYNTEYDSSMDKNRLSIRRAPTFSVPRKAWPTKLVVVVRQHLADGKLKARQTFGKGEHSVQAGR